MSQNLVVIRKIPWAKVNQIVICFCTPPSFVQEIGNCKYIVNLLGIHGGSIASEGKPDKVEGISLLPIILRRLV
jgi:hypothetical protein